MKPVLADRFHISKIGYFGSFATGSQHEDSDVDILVEFLQPLKDTILRQVKYV